MHAAAASRKKIQERGWRAGESKKKPGRMNYDKEDHASRVR